MLTGLFASDWLRRALVIAMVVAMFALTVLVHPAYVRHIGVVALLVIALAALGGTTAGRETTTFAAFNMIWAAQGLLAAGLALAGGGFAANTQAARWVVAEGLDGKRWVTESGIAADSLVVFTRQPVFNAKTGCWATFHRWNHSPSAFTSNERLMAGMQAAADTDGVVYVLVHGEPERAVPRDRLGLELIARFGPDNSAEVTWLYRAKVEPLGTSERKPLCP